MTRYADMPESVARHLARLPLPEIEGGAFVRSVRRSPNAGSPWFPPPASAGGETACSARGPSITGCCRPMRTPATS